MALFQFETPAWLARDMDYNVAQQLHDRRTSHKSMRRDKAFGLSCTQIDVAYYVVTFPLQLTCEWFSPVISPHSWAGPLL